MGIAALLLGTLLVFLISTTFTRPLANLVAGVHALEQGDYDFPLHEVGNDEVSELTSAFRRMRSTLQDTQGKLIESERLATLGQMASTISHDLRHPLTAILANAEFLSEDKLTAEQRQDFFQEIRIAVNRMTNELGSLLGFSRKSTDVRPAYGDLRQTVRHAAQTVQAVPEHQEIHIEQHFGDRTEGWFDPDKVERVLLNLLFNACEAVDPETGRIDITVASTDEGIVIRVADNGPGIPEEIRGQVFDPFVSHGKEKGIGLGLAVVQKIMQDHGGEVTVERTGPQGTTFLLRFPAQEHAAARAAAS